MIQTYDELWKHGDMIVRSAAVNGEWLWVLDRLVALREEMNGLENKVERNG